MNVIGAILGLLKDSLKWLVLAFAVFLAVLAIGNFLSVTDPIAQADAIVAISGGDTKTRTLAAIDLYKQGWAPKLIFSGAALDPVSPSNASVMRELAVRAGISNDNIYMEEKAIDTTENAIRSQRIFAELKTKRVILVTSGYHQRRASIEFRHAVGGQVEIINQPTHDKDWTSKWYLSPRGWFLAVTELLKVGFVKARTLI